MSVAIIQNACASSKAQKEKNKKKSAPVGQKRKREEDEGADLRNDEVDSLPQEDIPELASDLHEIEAGDDLAEPSSSAPPMREQSLPAVSEPDPPVMPAPAHSQASAAVSEPDPPAMPAPAHSRAPAAVSETQERTAGPRHAADELKCLLPPVAGLYVKWHVIDRKVWVDFTSLKDSGLQRTKTASWPRYCGLDPKVKAVSKVLDFVSMMWTEHFKGSPTVWSKPSPETIREAVDGIVTRLAK